MTDDSEIVRAYFECYGSKVYNPEANEAALEEQRKLEERKAAVRRQYPPSHRPIPRC